MANGNPYNPMGGVSEGFGSMADVLLRKRQQEEQSRQFDVRQAYDEANARPVREAAQMENDERRRAIQARGRGGQAFLKMLDRFYDEGYRNEHFVQKRKDGEVEVNPRTGEPIIGMTQLGIEMGRVAMEEGLTPMEFDVLVKETQNVYGEIQKGAELDRDMIANVRSRVELNWKSEEKDRLKKGLEDVKTTTQAAVTAGRMTPEAAALEYQGASERAAFEQTVAPTSTVAGAQQATKTAAEAESQNQPVTAKVQELRELIAQNKKADPSLSDADALNKATNDLYGSDLDKLLNVYSNASYILDPEDPIMVGMREEINNKVMGIKPPAEQQKTPSGEIYNMTNFPLMTRFKQYGIEVNDPDALNQLAQKIYEQNNGILTREDILNVLSTDYYGELVKGGWLK